MRHKFRPSVGGNSYRRRCQLTSERRQQLQSAVDTQQAKQQQLPTKRQHKDPTGSSQHLQQRAQTSFNNVAVNAAGNWLSGCAAVWLRCQWLLVLSACGRVLMLRVKRPLTMQHTCMQPGRAESMTGDWLAVWLRGWAKPRSTRSGWSLDVW